MKSLKSIVISSDGSINFLNNNVKTCNYINFKLQDDRNFDFYQKIKKFNVSSKHLKIYKKKYLF